MADPQRIQYFQQLRATGQPLPVMQDWSWESSLTRTSTGLFEVPRVGVHLSSNMDIPVGCALSIILAFLGVIFSIPMLYEYSFDPVTVVILAGIFFASVGAAILGSRRLGHPNLEISQLPLKPGQGALVMLPQGKGRSGAISQAWLVLRERVETVTQQGSTWTSVPLTMTPLVLNRSSASLLSANIRIPEDAPPSFEAPGYQLQWCIQVERQRGLTDYYRLWVMPPSLKAEEIKYLS